MIRTISACCISVLLLQFVSAAAKPAADLQSLRQLLDQDLDAVPFFSPEELQDQTHANTDKSVFGSAGEQPGSWPPPWDSDPRNSALQPQADKEPEPDQLLTRLLKDLMRTSKRSWSRYKKGGLRSCFGVRLDRIGSFSGLGC